MSEVTKDCNIHSVPVDVNVEEYSTNGKIIEIIKGPKKISKFFVDELSYIYKQNKKRKCGGFNLRCFSSGCSGSGLYQPEINYFQRLSRHSHTPNFNTLNKWRFLEKVKGRAEEEETKLKDIYEEEIKRFKNWPLPSFEKIQSCLQKRRKATQRPLDSEDTPNDKNDILSNDIRVTAFNSPILSTHLIRHKHIEIIEGPKRFSKIFIDDSNYCYLVNRKKSDTEVFLRCYQDGCRGSGVYYKETGNFKKITNHSHYADPHTVMKWRFLHTVKKRAENEETPLKLIYEEEEKRFADCNVPPFKQLRSTLHKRRRYLSNNVNQNEKTSISVIPKDNVNSIDAFQSEIFNIDLKNNSTNESHSIKTIKVNTSDPLPNLKLQMDQSNEPFADSELIYKKENHNTKSVECKAKKDIKPCKREKKKKVRRKRKLTSRLVSSYQSSMVIIEGEKRHSKIYLDELSFAYRFNKRKDEGVLILRCYESKCHASGYFFKDKSLFQQSVQHNHKADVFLIEKWKLLHRLKIRAENESTSLKVIYDEETSSHASVPIKPFKEIESTLHKARRRFRVASEPSTILEAKEKMQYTFKDFFRSHLRSDDDVDIFVFWSRGLLEEEFKRAKCVHFDSIFKVTPEYFSHILFIYIVSGVHAFPVVYALFTNCSEHAYLCLFNYLSKEFPEFVPTIIITDYEYILERALQIAYPKAIINGSWFYYVQAVWRQTQYFGIAQVFYQDSDVRSILKNVLSIPLLPANKIGDAICILRQKVMNSTFLFKETKAHMFSLINYVQEKWVERIGMYRLSAFKIVKHCSYDKEALYHIFVRKIGIKPLSLIRFVEKLSACDSAFINEFLRSNEGKKIRYDKSRKYLLNENIIKTAEEKLESNPSHICNFLDTVSEAVPCLHHHEDSHEINNIMISEDPSDVPNDMLFCEIGLEDPSLKDATSLSHSSHYKSQYNTNLPLAIEKIGKSPNQLYQQPLAQHCHIYEIPSTDLPYTLSISNANVTTYQPQLAISPLDNLKTPVTKGSWYS